MKMSVKTYCCIQSVEQALNVLEQFHGSEMELGISELSERLNLKKDKVFRLLATMESRNFIEQNQVMGKYRLGVKNFQLAQNFIRHMGLVQQARPVQEALVKMCNETSYVSVLKNYQTVYLDVVESDQLLRVVPQVGARWPLYCTAAGKVFATNINEEKLRKHYLIDGIRKYTDKTIVNSDTLFMHFRNVAQMGYAMYAIDSEELYEGVNSIGAPIRDYTGQIIGALSISVPTMRLTNKRTDQELVPLVMAAANEISVKLGFCH